MSTAPPAAELRLVLDTTAGDAHGYGYAWPSRVREVLVGTLSEDAILLNTYDSDPRYRGHFACCAPEVGLELGFRRRPDLPAALEGFIAKDGTIWELVDVKP